MKSVVMAWTLAAAATAATAGDFHLVDPATGRRIGPFDYVQGSTVTVAGVAYRIEKVDQAALTVDRLKKTIIPSIEFRQADIRDVVMFLAEASLERDPSKAGVNFVYHAPGPGEVQDPNDPFGSPPAPPVTITLNLRQVSLFDALKYVSEIANLEMTVDKDRVVLRPRAAVPERPVGPPEAGPRSEAPVPPPRRPDRPK